MDDSPSQGVVKEGRAHWEGSRCGARGGPARA